MKTFRIQLGIPPPHTRRNVASIQGHIYIYIGVISAYLIATTRLWDPQHVFPKTDGFWIKGIIFANKRCYIDHVVRENLVNLGTCNGSLWREEANVCTLHASLIVIEPPSPMIHHIETLEAWNLRNRLESIWEYNRAIPVVMLFQSRKGHIQQQHKYIPCPNAVFTKCTIQRCENFRTQYPYTGLKKPIPQTKPRGW